MTGAAHKSGLTDVQIEAAMQGVDAGHRLAGSQPPERVRQLGRMVLTGELTADQAEAMFMAEILPGS